MGLTPDELRTSMVDAIVAARPTSPQVEDAMRTVPRHEFVPAVPVEQAYDDVAVITKTAADGTNLSCASVPSLVAVMLDNLDVQPGHHVLEIGAGTGYNAALLDHLTGPTGHVTTVDIDPDVTAGARHALGHRKVAVITRDGALGAPEHAPYDRIIVTVGAWDIPTAWFDQLKPGGRLVVPLRWRGQTPCGRLRPYGDPLGVGLGRAVRLRPHDRPGRRTHRHHRRGWPGRPPLGRRPDHRPRSTARRSRPARHDVWSGVTLGPNQPFDGVWLRLTATEPGTCRIAAEQAAVDSGHCTPANPARSPAVVDGASLAYFTLRRLGDHRLWELGATGHGADGPYLAERLCDQIRAWNADREQQPVVSAYPISAPSTERTFSRPCIQATIVY